MDKIFEKIEQYDIFNSLIPGVMYTFWVKRLYGKDLGADGVVEYLVVCYLLGIIISRFGSVCVEYILKDMLKFVNYADNSDYIEAEAKDPIKKITKLNMINNMYRSLLAMAVLVGATGLWILITSHCMLLKSCEKVLIVLFLVLLFAFSYRKQTEYVRKRVEKILMDERN